jgi:hypothetical protein
MSTVLICREALEDSVLGNIALARAVVRQGGQAVVLFKEAGLPLGHGELDRRWSDVRSLVRSMATEPDLRLIACPLWSRFLSLGKEPDYLERIDEVELVELLSKADSIVGGY